MLFITRQAVRPHTEHSCTVTLKSVAPLFCYFVSVTVLACVHCLPGEEELCQNLPGHKHRLYNDGGDVLL